jgi:hypothetical protein
MHSSSSFGLGAAATKPAVNVNIVIRIAAAGIRIADDFDVGGKESKELASGIF